MPPHGFGSWTNSTEARSSRHPGLKDIQPGCVTGLYHIFISNWPLGTSWRDVRDWVRPVAELDHAEVFLDGTSGWVRVRGEDAFHKTLGGTIPSPALGSSADITEARVHNVLVKDRVVRADARNATEAIPVRDLKVAGATPIPYTGYSGATMTYAAPIPTFAAGYLQKARARGFGTLETAPSSTYAAYISTDYSSSPASSSFYSQESTDWAWDGRSTCSWNTSWSPCQEPIGPLTAPTRTHHPDGLHTQPSSKDRPEKVPSPPHACQETTPPGSQLEWQPPLIVNGSNAWRPPRKRHPDTGWSTADNG